MTDIGLAWCHGMCTSVDLTSKIKETLDKLEGKHFSIITTLWSCYLSLFSIYGPPVILSCLTVLAFLLFIIVVKCYTKNERSKSIDWWMWLARLIAASLMSMVVVLIILKDKHISVYDYPPTNYLVIEMLLAIIPVNWAILDSSVR